MGGGGPPGPPGPGGGGIGLSGPGPPGPGPQFWGGGPRGGIRPSNRKHDTVSCQSKPLGYYK